MEHIGDDEYNISVEGCFCDFPCAKKHIDIFYPNICDNTKFSEMLIHLYYIFNGVRIAEIQPAKSKYQMVQYGGEKTKEEYMHDLKK